MTIDEMRAKEKQAIAQFEALRVQMSRVDGYLWALRDMIATEEKALADQQPKPPSSKSKKENRHAAKTS